jgi:hypothetical protein
MSQPTTAPRPRLVRPAITEIRFNVKKKYNDQVGLYSKLLGYTTPTPATNPPDSVLFPLNFAPAGDSLQALRLVFLKGGRKGADRTITYWEVGGSGTTEAYDSIVKVRDMLLLPANGFKTVEGLPPKGPLLLKGKAVQTLLDDGSGNLVGLVINPPYPSFMKGHRPRPKAFSTDSLPHTESSSSSANVPLIGLGVLIGLLIGWGIARFIQQNPR